MRNLFLLSTMLFWLVQYVYAQEQKENIIKSLGIVKYIKNAKSVQVALAMNEERALHLGVSYAHFINTNASISFEMRYGSGNNYRGYIYNSLYNSIAINYLLPIKFIKNLYLGMGAGGVIALDDIKGRITEGEKAIYYPKSSNGLQFILRPELGLSEHFSININATQIHFLNAGDMIGRNRFQLGFGVIYFF